MLDADVSGRQSTISSRMGAEYQTISQSDQRHPLAVTAKPEMRGPSEGPQKAAATQTVMA